MEKSRIEKMLELDRYQRDLEKRNESRIITDQAKSFKDQNK